MTCTPDLVPFVPNTVLFAVISLAVAIFAAYMNGRKGGGVDFWFPTLAVAILICEVCAISISIELRAWDNYDWGIVGWLISLAAFFLIAALPMGLREATKDDYKGRQQSPASAEPAAAQA